MKFIVSDGKQLRNRLKIFPEYYQRTFLSSPILVLYVRNDNEIVGGCGISNISNYAQAYILKEYRGKGLGTKIEAKAYDLARKRGLPFVAGAIDLWNSPALRVAFKVGYKEVARFPKHGYILMMIPFNFKGELLYVFLHAMLPRVPETFLDHIVLLSMDLVGWIRRRLGAG